MTKKQVSTIIGCILLFVYMVISVSWSRWMAANEPCRGLEGDKIEVIDPQNVGYVTSASLMGELFGKNDTLHQTTFAQLNTLEIQDRLNALQTIEDAEVCRLCNGKLSIKVTPICPVARIWTSSSASYYFNRAGKRVKASSRYHIDVPQILANFHTAPTDSKPELRLLPLLDYLQDNPHIGALMSMIDARDTTNVYLTPAIRGHVINLGSLDNVPRKLHNLEQFYRQVMPHKGWEHYDTISLKWRGQIVATRRNNKLPDLSVKIIDELENEGDDAATASATLGNDSVKTP